MILLKLALLIVLVVVAQRLWRRFSQARRRAYIESYPFHPSIRRRVNQMYPQLDDAQLDLLFEGLRDYFAICLAAGRKPVAMPSKAVDAAWHTFIVYTRAYQDFCRRGLGRFLHHTPVEVMASPTTAQQGIKRAWRLACHREGINPRVPERLPRLFAIDGLLGIPDGFVYTPDCRNRDDGRSDRYCAGDIACSSDCLGDSGAPGSDSSGGLFDGNGGGSDCGSGCGGD